MDFANSGSTASLHSQSSSTDDSLIAFIDSPATEQSIDAIQEMYSLLKTEYNIPDDSTWTDNARVFAEHFNEAKMWKGERLLRTLQGRSSLPEHREYFSESGDRICAGKRILVIGAGPVGLRFAIEAAFMGAKVDLIEMRDSFSRNNCLHLWPFLVEDLKGLEAKMFYGKFCSGQLDHICIRAAQVILMKICLILGVNIYHRTKFLGYREPTDKVGWRAECHPRNSVVNDRDYDVIVAADGKKYTLDFKKKEFRAKLAIGISFNFINGNTAKENEVTELSGISYLYHQDWFRKLSKEHGIDLENIVYYKDETHYFVMTAKRQSLLKKGVFKKDYTDAARLIDSHNINQKKLENFAIESAKYATGGKMPHFVFSQNHQGENDVALFDFTSLFASQHASRIIKRKGRSLLLLVAGDTLIEPFWPTGSGLARGFLGAFDAAWMIRGYVKGYEPLMLLEEREAILQLLSQTTPHRLLKNYAKYSIDPHTRYNLSQEVLVAGDIRHLYDTDDPSEIEKWDLNFAKDSSPVLKKHNRRAHIRKLTGKKQYKVGSPGGGDRSDQLIGSLKRTCSEPALALNKESPNTFISPAKKFINTFMSKKPKKELKYNDKDGKHNFAAIPEEHEAMKADSDSYLCPGVSVSYPDIDPISHSSSLADLASDSNAKLSASSSEASAADVTVELDRTQELPSSPVISRPRSHTSKQTPDVTPPQLLNPLRNRSATVGVDSLSVRPIEEAESFENLSLIKTDSPLVVERRLSPGAIARSKLSGGFIFSHQVTNNLKLLLASFVQEVGLQESRYSLELIIYIFRNCQSHSVDEKYYRIPLVSQAFFNRVWQYNTGRLFMMQCQWTIMDDLLVLNLGFDLSKPFQFLERKLDTVCHKLASLAMTGDGRKSKKYNQKEIRFFDKEIYDAIPCLKQIPEDLNASFTESKLDNINSTGCTPTPSFQPRRLSPPNIAPYKPEPPQTQTPTNSMFKPLCLQIRPSPLQIGGYGVSSPLERATTPLSKSPPSPPRPPKGSSSPARSSASQGSPSHSFHSFESSEAKNEVFLTPETSFTQSPPQDLASTTTSTTATATTTTTTYTIPIPSNNNVTTSTPLVPKSIFLKQTPTMSVSENSITMPDNSDIPYKLTADKIGLANPSDSFMDVSLPDNSKPIQDIRGNREAEQLVMQQATANRLIWKLAEQEKIRQIQAEKTPAKRRERTSISSPAGQVVAVMPAHFEFPKLKHSGSESPSPRVSPNSSPPPWAAEVKLRSLNNTPGTSPLTSPKYRQKYEEPIFDLRDREAEKTLSKKTASTRQLWLQNEAIATGKPLRPGSAVSCEDLLNKPISPTERPNSAVNTRTKWPLREIPSNLDIVKGSDPLDKRSLHMEEKMLLQMTKTKNIVMQI